MDFIERNNIRRDPKEITVIDDAPYDLRVFIATLVEINAGQFPGDNRVSNIGMALSILCLSIGKGKEGHWGYDYINSEIRTTLEECDWWKLYKFIEDYLNASLMENLKDQSRKKINQFFEDNGIGWRINEEYCVVRRGNIAFEESIRNVISETNRSGQQTTSTEIHEAIKDLSRKPVPDLTGAIQHAMAALECLCKEVTNEPSKTLGKVIKSNPSLFPSPLGEAIHKLWGYASDNGRHLHEGGEPSLEEAELVVHVSASLCLYLSKKLPAIPSSSSLYNFPF